MKKNFFVNPLAQQQQQQDPMRPTYIKPDGTKVIEKKEIYGKIVYEVCPDGALLFRSYNTMDVMTLDYARDRNYEIGHRYDEYGNMIYKFDAAYDEHNKLAIKNEYDYDYYDDGTKKTEIITKFPSGITTYMSYDEKGNRTEKIEERGAVKTWFDINDKPFKREIDRGSGGIITQDLTQGQ